MSSCKSIVNIQFTWYRANLLLGDSIIFRLAHTLASQAVWPPLYLSPSKIEFSFNNLLLFCFTLQRKYWSVFGHLEDSSLSCGADGRPGAGSRSRRQCSWACRSGHRVPPSWRSRAHWAPPARCRRSSVPPAPGAWLHRLSHSCKGKAHYSISCLPVCQHGYILSCLYAPKVVAVGADVLIVVAQNCGLLRVIQGRRQAAGCERKGAQDKGTSVDGMHLYWGFGTSRRATAVVTIEGKRIMWHPLMRSPAIYSGSSGRNPTAPTHTYTDTHTHTHTERLTLAYTQSGSHNNRL